MKKLISYLVLPPEISAFERQYLNHMTRVGLWFFYAHLPVIMLVAFLAKTSIVRAGIYTSVALVGPTLARRAFDNPRHITRAFAFTATVLGGLLVHFGQGPMQIEMHFHFFVLIALLAVFGDPLVVVVAAVSVAAHHVLLWLIAPASVFNYEASAWSIVVHALFVVAESIAACFVARSFFDNVIGLERVFRTKNEELEHRTDQMTLVLENVEQGLVLVAADGTLGARQSAVLGTLIGAAVPNERIWDWVARVDACAGEWLELGWSMLTDDFLPLSAAIDQLPKRISHGGRVLQLSYRPLVAEPTFGGLLFVVTDVTSEVERERYECEQREMLTLFERVLHDRSGVVEFAEDASKVVQETCEGAVDTSTVRRLLHTLKGNAGSFGCGSLATVCHDIESRLEESGRLGAQDRIDLRAGWDRCREKLTALVGEREHEWYEITPAEHEAVVRAVREGAARDSLLARLEAWTLEPTEIRLRRLADQARHLASRLGKGEIDVRIAANGVRLLPERLRPFWAGILHVLRNAIDHGLETPAERRAAGKPAQGVIDLSTRFDEGSLVIQVSDDGRGVDWGRVRECAVARGAPATTQADLVAALFLDGLSTRESLSEFSGRGVGMSAVLATCNELGGTIEVLSTAEKGTVFTVTLPRQGLDGDLRRLSMMPYQAVA